MRTLQADKAIKELFKDHMVNFQTPSGERIFTAAFGEIESKDQAIKQFLNKIWTIFEDKLAHKTLKQNKSSFGSWVEYSGSWETKPGYKATCHVRFKEENIIVVSYEEHKKKSYES